MDSQSITVEIGPGSRRSGPALGELRLSDGRLQVTRGGAAEARPSADAPADGSDGQRFNVPGMDLSAAAITARRAFVFDRPLAEVLGYRLRFSKLRGYQIELRARDGRHARVRPHGDVDQLTAWLDRVAGVRREPNTGQVSLYFYSAVIVLAIVIVVLAYTVG